MKIPLDSAETQHGKRSARSYNWIVVSLCFVSQLAYSPI